MKVFRQIFITISVIVFATLAVNAVDNAGDLKNSLLGSIIFSGKEKSLCPDDMVYVLDSQGSFCIDKYEDSAGESCKYKNPKSNKETNENLAIADCLPVSVKGALPWVNIARHQAELACSRAGKRLPTSREWYHAALGTLDKNNNWSSKDCNVNTASSDGVSPTGSHELCKSPSGAYDMIGNVWEWIEETVYDGKYNSRLLPKEGYVRSIDNDGMVLETDVNEPDPAFFNDYFWINHQGSRGILRGGFWNSKSDGGQYSINITVPPSFASKGVGFRCVKEAE